MNIQDILSIALDHHQAGRFIEAATLYQQALENEPDNPDILHLLGMLAHQAGDNKTAIDLINRAIQINPNAPAFHNNLGTVYQKLPKIPEAIDCYRKALTLMPDYPMAHCNLGTALKEQNKLLEAIGYFQRALALKPDYPAALNNLGITLVALGKSAEAVSCFQQALAFDPNCIETHNNLADAMREQGRLDEAIVCFQKILEQKPDYAEAHNNLGLAFLSQGKSDEAISCFQHALALKTDLPDAYNNLGNALTNKGEVAEAVTYYQQAVLLKPDYAEAFNNLGIAFDDLGEVDEAIASFQKALALKPDYAEVYNNWGNTLKDQNKVVDAIICYQQALALKNDFAEAQHNLGIAFIAQDKFPEAINSFRKALTLRPDFAEAHNNLGDALRKHGMTTAAISCFQKALELKPEIVEAHVSMGIMYRDQGKFDDAITCYRKALLCNPDNPNVNSDLIFTRDLMVQGDTQSLQAERKHWDHLHAAHFLQNLHHPNTPDPKRRLRIGYVSADFRMHSAAYVFGAMLLKFDPSQFDVYTYSNTTTEDRYTEFLQQRVTQWRKIVGLSDDVVAELIRQDSIDILVDLSGHSGGNRLLVFARKPAPIQITAWGYIGGTGMKAMDVFFADPVVVPPEEKQFYAEEVRYLPNVVEYYFPDPFPETNALPATSSNGVTFGSFNRLVKISDEAYRVWAQILLAIPNSRMVLKTAELDNASVRARVLEYFTQAGIDAKRVTLLGKTFWRDHMTAFNQIDIALDPFPHGGGVTTLEGLMMGVPVVTLRWPTIVGRLSSSILTTIELADWIAETTEQYVAIAKKKAQNLPELIELRQTLRARLATSIIGDTDAYVSSVEREYRSLWRQWCEETAKERNEKLPSI